MGDGREARVDAEAAQELADVVPHRLLREPEGRRDLRRGGAVGEESKHFRQTIWFDAIKAKAELAYLQAHTQALQQLLGGK